MTEFLYFLLSPLFLAWLAILGPAALAIALGSKGWAYLSMGFLGVGIALDVFGALNAGQVESALWSLGSWAAYSGLLYGLVLGRRALSSVLARG